MTTQEALDGISKEKVISWLKTKDETEFVGFEHQICQCPIAQFYKENYGETVAVGNFWDLSTFKVLESLDDDFMSGSVNLPDWMREFAEAVDEGEASVEVDEFSESYRPTAGKLIQLLTNN